MPSTESYRTAGECASDAGATPRVSLFCPPRHMIHVLRSFHGSRAPSPTGDRCATGSNCTYCPGDCIDETAGVVYDWTACTGRKSCSRTVLQSLMPHCSRGPQPAVTASPAAQTSEDRETNDVAVHSATWEHFSDYINVDYDCINRMSFSSSRFELKLSFLSKQQCKFQEPFICLSFSSFCCRRKNSFLQIALTLISPNSLWV